MLRAVELWCEDPVARALAAAPFDDGPETPEERAAVEEARDRKTRRRVLDALLRFVTRGDRRVRFVRDAGAQTVTALRVLPRGRAYDR